jgi:hypothetical protein
VDFTTDGGVMRKKNKALIAKLPLWFFNDKYFSGELEDYADPEDALKASLASLPRVAA